MTTGRFISRVVFKYTLVIDGSGATQDYWVTTHGFRTKPSETPSNTLVEERVMEAGSYQTSLFGGGKVLGACRPSYGITKLNNADGGLDDFVRFAAGGYVTCYYGDDSAVFPTAYTTVFTTKIFSVIADFDVITVRYRDRLQDLETPVVTALLAGTGELEGFEGVSGKKPVVFGRPGLVPLTLIDKERQIYLIQANAVDSQFMSGSDPFANVFEGGNLVARDTNPFYVSSAEMFSDAGEPAPNTCKFWTGYEGTSLVEAAQYTRGPVYVRLGTPPTGDLRIGARGALQNTGDSSSKTWRFTDLCNRAGMSDVTDSTIAVLTSNTFNQTVGNSYVTDDRTYLDLMNDRAMAKFVFFGFDQRGKFFCSRLKDPADTIEGSNYTFTYHNSKNFTRVPISGMESPDWQVNVNSGKTFPVTPLSGASPEMQDLVSRDPWSVVFNGTSDEVKKAYPGAGVTTLDIDGNDFTSGSDRAEFLSNYADLYGKPRDFVTLTCVEFSPATLTLFLHDKVTLQVPRFDYSAGKLFRVVDININLDSKEITFVLWGSNTDEYVWVKGGGGYPTSIGSPGGSDGGSILNPPGTVTSIALTNSVIADFGGQYTCTVSSDALTASSLIEPFLGSYIGVVSQYLDVLICNFDGTHGATSFTDLSAYGRTLTGNSNCALSNAHSPFGGTSLKIDKRDHGGIITATVADLAFAANEPFTMETWVYYVSSTNFTQAPLLLSWGHGAAYDTLASYSNVAKFSYDNDQFGAQEPTPLAYTANTWIHVAITYDGTNVKRWKQGVLDFTLARTFGAVATGTLQLAGVAGSTGATDGTEIYMGPTRFSRGCRYTTTFTPPTGNF